MPGLGNQGVVEFLCIPCGNSLPGQFLTGSHRRITHHPHRLIRLYGKCALLNDMLCVMPTVPSSVFLANPPPQIARIASRAQRKCGVESPTRMECAESTPYALLPSPAPNALCRPAHRPGHTSRTHAGNTVRQMHTLVTNLSQQRSTSRPLVKPLQSGNDGHALWDGLYHNSHDT